MKMKRKSMDVMPAKQPKLRASKELSEKVAMFMASSASAVRPGDADAPDFENDAPPEWVSKLAKDAAKGLPEPKPKEKKAVMMTDRIAVLPLVSHTIDRLGRPSYDLSLKAQDITFALREAEIDAIFVEAGPISRRYKAADEVGVRACLTVDPVTIKNQTVVVREHGGKKKQYRAKIKSVIKKFKPEIHVGRKHGRVFITKGGKPYGAQG